MCSTQLSWCCYLPSIPLQGTCNLICLSLCLFESLPFSLPKIFPFSPCPSLFSSSSWCVYVYVYVLGEGSQWLIEVRKVVSSFRMVELWENYYTGLAWVKTRETNKITFNLNINPPPNTKFDGQKMALLNLPAKYFKPSLPCLNIQGLLLTRWKGMWVPILKKSSIKLTFLLN